MKAVGKAATRHVRHVSRLTRKYVSSAAQAPLPHRVMDFSGGQVGVLFLLLILVASIPIWTHPLPPMADYVNHIARMHVIASGAADQKLSQYYQIDWQIVPNLMMDLIVPVLGRGMNIYLAGQIFTVFMFLVIMSGMLAFNRALFGRWSVLPLIAIPLLYNHVFLVGVMNYLFGIGLAMWALAAWIYLREWAWPWRYAASSVFVVLMFFCHLFAVGLYGIGLLAYEAWRLWLKREQPWPHLLVDFCASGIPLLIAIPLLLASPTLQLAGENYWEPRGKLDGLLYVIEVYSDVVAFLITGLIVIAVTWAVPRRLMRLHPIGWPLLAISILVYLAMPRTLFASYMADQRLPVAIAFMMVATADLRMPRRAVRRAFIALVLMLLVVRVIEVDVLVVRPVRHTKQFRTSVKRIAPGSKVLVAYADNTSGDRRQRSRPRTRRLYRHDRAIGAGDHRLHRARQADHARASRLSRFGRYRGRHPALDLAAYRRGNASDRQEKDYWRGWTNKYDYLYVLFTADDAANPDPARLTLVQDSERFQLYRIKRPG